MAENKTQPTNESVTDFLQALTPESRQSDALVLHHLMEKISGEKAVLWGSIVGYGQFRYKYPSGCSGDWFFIGFAPRKTAFSLYLCLGGVEKFQPFLEKLGPHTHGVGCLYLKSLAKINLDVLEELVNAAFIDMKNTPFSGH